VQGLEALFALRAIAQQVDDVPTGCGHGGSNPNPVRRDRPLRRTSEAADCRSDPFRPTGRSTAKGSCDRTTGVVRGTESLLTLRWSGMDSNVQFRARWATVCGFVRVGSDGPAHGHPSSCRPRRTARVSGGGPGRRHSPPGSGGRHTKVALSAVRAHRGTEGSNPFPSTEESANFQSLTAKRSRKRGFHARPACFSVGGVASTLRRRDRPARSKRQRQNHRSDTLRCLSSLLPGF
jgi:hypothetical protein